ncbi:MAG: hypothetical protein ACM3X9_08415 [Bacillota bacterium]
MVINRIYRNHILLVVFDIIVINLAWFASLILRFDGRVPDSNLHHWWGIALVVSVIRIAVLWRSGLTKVSGVAAV